jgi:hypothetical protein
MKSRLQVGVCWTLSDIHGFQPRSHHRDNLLKCISQEFLPNNEVKAIQKSGLDSTKPSIALSFFLRQFVGLCTLRTHERQ